MELRSSFLALPVILFLSAQLVIGLPTEARQDNNPGFGTSSGQFSFGQGPRPANTKGFSSNPNPEQTLPAKTTDSYGNPVQYLNAPHGKPIEIGVKTDVNKDTGTQLQGDYRILTTSGLQFAIPSYASGITEIREPLDGLLPPLESGEDETDLEPIMVPIISPTVDVPPPLPPVESQFPPLNNPNPVSDISQNEIVRPPKFNNISQPIGDPKKNDPTNRFNQPEEDKTPESYGVKYTGGFGGPPGFLGEQKDIGYAIKEKNEKEKAEVDASSTAKTESPLNTTPSEVEKAASSHVDKSMNPVFESSLNQPSFNKPSFPPYPMQFDKSNVNPSSGSRQPTTGSTAFPPFPGSTNNDPIRKPESAANQPNSDGTTFSQFPTPLHQSSTASPSGSKQSGSDRPSFPPFPTSFNQQSAPKFESGPVLPPSHSTLNPLPTPSTYSPSTIPSFSNTNQPSLPKFEPNLPNFQTGLNPTTFSANSPASSPRQPNINQPIIFQARFGPVPNYQTGLIPPSLPNYPTAPNPQTGKDVNPNQSPFPKFAPHPALPLAHAKLPEYNQNPAHSDKSQQQIPSFGQGPLQGDEYTKNTDRITVPSNPPSFQQNLNDQSPNPFIPTFAPIPISPDSNDYPSKQPTNFPLPFQSSPGTFTHPNVQPTQNTHAQPNLNPINQQPHSAPKFTPPNNVHNGQPIFSVTTKPKAPSDDAPGKYNGGFGGAPGVLGEQKQPGFAVKPDGTIKDPDHAYRPPAIVPVTAPKPIPTFQPVLPTHVGPTSHQSGSAPGKYTGGFGGPPGVLSPFDKH